MSGTLDAIMLLAALAGGILWEMVKIRQTLERLERIANAFERAVK
jgi:hypothetical protein